ncbi:hypothetical protein P7C73_g5371, partial [Tremellales sp. Uapishka_1]
PRRAPRPHPPPAANAHFPTFQSTAHAFDRSTLDRLSREELVDKLSWYAQQEFSHPLQDYDEVPVHIPRRYRDAAAAAGAGAGPSSRPAAALNGMDEAEYTEYIRAGMYRMKHKDELARAERARLLKEQQARDAEQKREAALREERRRIERLRQERSSRVEGERRMDREKWARAIERWRKEKDEDVVAVRLKWREIPWPVYDKYRSRIEDITLENVRAFLSSGGASAGAGAGAGSAGGGGLDGKELKKVLREAILLFHPDRFFSKYLQRIKESEVESVREGVEKCSRIINQLIGEAK